MLSWFLCRGISTSCKSLFVEGGVGVFLGVGAGVVEPFPVQVFFSGGLSLIGVA